MHLDSAGLVKHCNEQHSGNRSNVVCTFLICFGCIILFFICGYFKESVFLVFLYLQAESKLGWMKKLQQNVCCNQQDWTNYALKFQIKEEEQWWVLEFLLGHQEFVV